jgi:MFS family permease
MIAILQPQLTQQLHWSETDYGNIVFWSQLAFAFGYLACGPLDDPLGARAGYALAVNLWTVAHVAHAWASSLAGFTLVRFGIGVRQLPRGTRGSHRVVSEAGAGLGDRSFSTQALMSGRSSPRLRRRINAAGIAPSPDPPSMTVPIDGANMSPMPAGPRGG